MFTESNVLSYLLLVGPVLAAIAAAYLKIKHEVVVGNLASDALTLKHHLETKNYLAALLDGKHIVADLAPVVVDAEKAAEGVIATATGAAH